MIRRLRAILALASSGTTENRQRATYLSFTLAITVAAWLVLSAMAAPYVGSGNIKGSGITIRNGNGQAPLPLSYARRIEAVPGARNVAWLGLQIVKCGATATVTINAWGGPGADAQLTQQKASAATIRHWNADPLGILVSNSAASKCGWQVGEGIDPHSVMGGKQIALHISGTLHDSGQMASMPVGFAHFAYINRVAPLMGKDKVTFYMASARNPRNAELLAARIEAEFAHDFPTVRATTNATVQNAWTRFGKVQQLIAFVMAAILLCAASVLVSMLAHAAAQRRAKFALLQVLGFQRGALFGALVLEVLVVMMAGALIGVGIGNLVAHELASTAFGLFSGGFAIPVGAYWWMPAWLAALLIVALMWPAAVVAQVRPADYRAI